MRRKEEGDLDTGMKQDVFVIGLDELNLRMLYELSEQQNYRFHPLLSVAELRQGEEIDLVQLVEKAQHQLDTFHGTVAAIIGFWDFPVSSMVPLLSERNGLRSASLESVVKCEHKYWSRLEQRKVIDEYPPFGLLMLDKADRPPEGVRYPMWLKPVKSTSSALAYHVENDAEFDRAVAEIRRGVHRLGRPFDWVLSHLDLPPEIAKVGAQACLAEESVNGDQVTVEGYVRDHDVQPYGIVDSVNYPDRPSFLRYQYPSTLPAQVLRRLADIARRVIRQLGLNHTTFNVEFFWDRERDEINLLEVNPRHSQSHAPLFAYVDGIPNHQCMVRLALGRDPALPHMQGPYNVAAKWFLRRFTDGTVRRSPTQEEVVAVEQEIPGTIVDVYAHVGDRLSELALQDSYSYELARIYVGAEDESELHAKYDQCVRRLPFEFDDIDEIDEAEETKELKKPQDTQETTATGSSATSAATDEADT